MRRERLTICFIFMIISVVLLNGFCGEPIINAAMDNDVEALKNLVEQQEVDVNFQDATGYTALMAAAVRNNVEALEYLLNKGADVNLQNNEGWTALIYAAAHEEPTEEDDEGIIDIDEASGEEKTSTRHIKTVELLLEHDADVNIADNKGWTALVYALEREYETVADLLFDYGADINYRTEDGKSSIIVVVKSGRLELTKTVINKGADVNIRDDKGKSALIYAIENGKEEIIKLLIEKGADKSIKVSENGKEKTPLEMAKEKELSSEVIKLLE